MGKISQPHSVKLIIGFIYRDDKFLSKAKIILKKLLGKIDFESKVISFSYTDYYEKEIGKNLKRTFISFNKLILPNKLSRIKILTNKIENGLSLDGKNRTINIDPGYLDLSKLVLATTKDFSHRIYLDKGIYAEVTLSYQDKAYRPWAWTYPDYRSQEYAEIFNQIRKIYNQQVSK